MHRFALFVAIALTAAGIGCSEPVPDHQLDYVGVWKNERTEMEIKAEGRFGLIRPEANGPAAYDLPLLEISDEGIRAGVPFFSTFFETQGPPARTDGFLRLDLDGARLRKVDPDDPTRFLLTVPTADVLERLIREDTNRLLEGFVRDDFSEYVAGLAPPAQAVVDAEALRNAYARLRDWNLDVAAFQEGEIRFTAEPFFDQNQVLQIEAVVLDGDGQLLSTKPGFVPTPEGLKSIGTEMTVGTYRPSEP